MPDFSRRAVRMLDDDHRATSALLDDLDRLLAESGRQPPDSAAPGPRALLGRAAEAIDNEIGAHFTFEEEALFPLLRDAGEDEICTHLCADHETLLPLARSVAERARAGLAEGFDTAAWRAFADAAGQLIESLRAHIEKEDRALLPLLEDTLSPETDMALAGAR